MAVAPLAPELPEFAGLAVSLLALAGALVALGMVYILDAMTKATVGTLGKVLGTVPLIGGYLESPVNSVYHWMNGVFSAAEAKLDGVIAFWLHSIAALVHWMGAEIEQNARWLHLLTGVVLGTRGIDAIGRLADYAANQAANARQIADAALARANHLERTLTSRVEAAVLPRLRVIDHTIDWTIPHDIATIRDRARETLDRLDNLWQRVRKLDALLGTAAITGALAIALTRLDLNWIRCRNWNRLGKSLCGVPFGLIDAVLADGIIALAATDLCDLSYAITIAAEQFEPVMLEFVDVEEALVGCHGNTKPADRTLPVLHLPPLQTQLSLAA